MGKEREKENGQCRTPLIHMDQGSGPPKADEQEKGVASSCPILQLPPELLIQIFSPLNARDLASLCLSCSHLGDLISSCQPVWKNLLKRMLLMNQAEEEGEPQVSYFHIFQEGEADEQLMQQATELLSVLPPDTTRHAQYTPPHLI